MRKALEFRQDFLTQWAVSGRSPGPAHSPLPAMSRRVCYDPCVAETRSEVAGWTPEQVAAGRQWVQTWREAGPELERIRRDELRRLNARQAIALLCGPGDYTVPPRSPKPTSGLVEQQRWFRMTRP